MGPRENTKGRMTRVVLRRLKLSIDVVEVSKRLLVVVALEGTSGHSLFFLPFFFN